MRKELPTQSHALISLAITVLLFVLLYCLVVMPLDGKMHSLDASIETKSAQMMKFQSISNERAQVEKDLTQAQAAMGSDSNFIKSDNSTLAVAILQENVKSIIHSSGGTLISIQDTASSRSENIDSVHLKVIMSGDIGALKGILYQLSGNQPLLFLDKLDIQKTNDIRSTRTRNTLAGSDIRVSFEVSAYILESGK